MMTSAQNAEFEIIRTFGHRTGILRQNEMYAQALLQDQNYHWFWTFSVNEDLEDNLSYRETVIFKVYFDGRLRHEVEVVFEKIFEDEIQDYAGLQDFLWQFDSSAGVRYTTVDMDVAGAQSFYVDANRGEQFGILFTSQVTNLFVLDFDFL